MTNFKQKAANYIAKLIKPFIVDKGGYSEVECFDIWQRNGFHITPNDYYQPIADTSILPKSVFNKKEMKGVYFDDKLLLSNLNKLKEFKKEYDAFPKLHKKVDGQTDPKFYLENLAFEGVDALVYYGMIRLHKPKQIVEIGSGWSTKIAATAVLKNGNANLTSIEPYPQPILEKGFPGFSKLIKKRVENVPLKVFESLKKGDFLFIDSSHTVRIGGDVNYEILEILPHLTKGVYIHFHDIFLPFDYPSDWVIKKHRFWSEQYLLQAFLAFNDSFKIVYSKGYLYDKYPSEMKKVFPKYPAPGGGSVWLVKVK